MKLEVVDSPNSAGIVIDAVRCCKLALDRGVRGALEGPSAYFMKAPPRQYSEPMARQLTEEFIAGAVPPEHNGHQPEPVMATRDALSSAAAGPPLREPHEQLTRSVIVPGKL
jgi:hypothetical protein